MTMLLHNRMGLRAGDAFMFITFAQAAAINLVPEPASLILISLGALPIRRR